MTSRGDSTHRPRPLRAGVLLAAWLLAFCPLYFRALDYPFLLDEIQWIATVKEAGLSRLFEPNVDKFRPLTYLAYALLFHLFGLRPAGYYLVNILLHLANTLLAYRLMQQVSAQFGPVARAGAIASFVSALVFFVSFSHYQAVLWIGALPTLLSAGLCLGSAWAFLRYAQQKKPAQLFGSLLMYAFSLLAKEQGVLFPLVYPLLWRLGQREARLGALRAMALFLLVGLFLTAVMLIRMGGSGVHLDPYYRLGWHILENFGVALWQLSQEMVGFSQSLGLPDAPPLRGVVSVALVAAAGLLLLSAARVWARRRAPLMARERGPLRPLLFSSTAFVVTFLPYSFFVTLDTDRYIFHPLYHYLYLPSLFFIFSMLLLLATALDAKSRLQAGLFTLFVAGALALNAQATYHISRRLGLLGDFKQAVVHLILQRNRQSRLKEVYLVDFPPVFTATFFLGQELALHVRQPPLLRAIARREMEGARKEPSSGALFILFEDDGLRVVE